MFQIKDFSRDRIHVLLRLDVSKLDLTGPGVHRADKDFPPFEGIILIKYQKRIYLLHIFLGSVL